jgi:hypothetical protein
MSTLASALEGLSGSYQTTLGAAEIALAQGTRLVEVEPDAKPGTHSLRHLREELSRIVEERPELLGARFDRYLEALAAQARATASREG